MLRSLCEGRSMMRTMRLACPFVAALFVLAAAAIFAPILSAQGLTAPDRKSDKPTPRTADGHPDLGGYWKGTRETHTGGNLGQDLPGFKLPLTPAGEEAMQH